VQTSNHEVIKLTVTYLDRDSLNFSLPVSSTFHAAAGGMGGSAAADSQATTFWW
jgi:hypothetical protein